MVVQIKMYVLLCPCHHRVAHFLEMHHRGEDWTSEMGANFYKSIDWTEGGAVRHRTLQ